MFAFLCSQKLIAFRTKFETPVMPAVMSHCFAPKAVKPVKIPHNSKIIMSYEWRAVCVMASGQNMGFKMNQQEAQAPRLRPPS